ncbi:MAG: histidine kinase dimerization/phospho-acceptor domain-containing protein, partial [Pyrinomonadaceae bacterium]
MSQPVSDKSVSIVSCAETDEQRAELHSLSAEIVDLLYTQTFSPGEIATPREACAAFSEILLRHWQLCCINIYLRGDDGSLQESAIYTDKHLDEEKAREVGRLLVENVEREGRELSCLEQTDGPEQTKPWQSALKEAGLEACVGVPIHVRGSLVAVLVVITAKAERLRAALSGIRFVAAPIIIAVGNARRTQALNEQRQHIELLVEELKQHGSALEQANQELRRVSLYRSLFLARMSHELRTPLTAILGFTEILIDQE